MFVQKDKVISLVEELKARSQKTYTEIRSEMSTYLKYPVSRNMFENAFRHKVGVGTRYDPEMVQALIHCFLNQKDPLRGIHVYECLLIISWTSTPFSLVKTVFQFYPRELCIASLMVFLEDGTSTGIVYSWFDQQDRMMITSKIDQLSAMLQRNGDDLTFPWH